MSNPPEQPTQPQEQQEPLPRSGEGTGSVLARLQQQERMQANGESGDHPS